MSVVVKAFELRELALAIKKPFTTSFGTQYERNLVLVRAIGEEREGWGECVVMGVPWYNEEYVEGAIAVIEKFLAPKLLAHPRLTAEMVGPTLSPIIGHRMAKGALEMAVLDLELRERKQSLAEHFGVMRDRVPSGVSVGIVDTIDELVADVGGYLDEGYSRIKIKIKPGWDIEPVRALRGAFGDEFPLQVDANTAYSLSDARHLAKLDDFGLLLIEQPLGESDFREHAELAKLVATPICLDESVTSAKAAADAIILGATTVINVKPGRVGGYLEARRIHDLCRATGVAAWCGGMLETGIGRAANAALAALPGFTLTGDISASDRFYAEDITEPFVLDDGHIAVPRGMGLGVEPIMERVDKFTRSVITVTSTSDH